MVTPGAVSKVSPLSSTPAPAGSGVPGRRGAVCHRGATPGGESGAAPGSGEEGTGHEDHGHMGTQVSQGGKDGGSAPGRRAAGVQHTPPHALGFLKGLLDLKGRGRQSLKIPFV